MGLLGIAARVAGTAILTVTGGTTSILQQAAEMSGNDSLAELAGAGKEASFGAIKNMWDGVFDRPDNNNDDGEEESAESAEIRALMKDVRRYRGEIGQLKRFASEAKKVGNEEKYEFFTSKIEPLQEKIDSLMEEVEALRRGE